jgi:ABC-type glycerol-3-phosphate transport system substrate-binding protein
VRGKIFYPAAYLFSAIGEPEKYRPNKPSWSIIYIFLIFSLFLSSCSRGTPSASTPEPGQTNGGKTIITFGSYEYQRRLYEPLIETFQNQNPDIIVQFVDLNQAMMELYAENQEWNPFTYYRGLAKATDTFMVSGPYPSDMSRYFRDLQPLYEADPTFQVDDFWPGILSSCEDPYGNMVGLPLNATVSGIFYDPAAFDAISLPYPQPGWTFDDFQKAVSALTEERAAGTRYGYYDQAYINGSVLMPLLSFHMQKHGGEVAAGEFLKEIQWYVDMAKADLLVPIKDSEDMEFEWEQRMKLYENEATRPAMWPDSLIAYPPSGAITYEPNDPFAGTTIATYGFVPMPVSTDGSLMKTSMSWTECASISAGSANPRAAWTWLNFISQQNLVMDSNEVFELGRAPARKPVADAIGYWDQLPAKAVPAVRYALEHSFFTASNSSYYDVTGEVNNALGKMIAGKGDFERELAAAVSARQPTPTPPADNAPIVVATPLPPLAEGVSLVKYFISDVSNLNELPALKVLVDQFNQRLTDQQIRIVTDFYGEPDEDWFVSMARAFDCYTTNAPNWEYTDPSLLLDINPLFTNEPASFTGDFLPQLLDKYRKEGRLYGLPVTSQVQMMAYNADLLTRRGLPLPENDWTFDQFIQLANAAASTSESDPSYGFMFKIYDDFFLAGRDLK